jgi:hypothetical protein
MVGKASLLVVLGFSLIFLVFGQKFNSLSNQSIDNMTDYYAQTVSHDCAVAGANMAANKVFLDPTWNTGFSNQSFNGGKFNTTVQLVDAFKNRIQITSVGAYAGVSHTVKVLLQPSSFSKFAYYSVSEGGTIWWTGGDTVWGPFHTQDYLRAHQHPVFVGKATTKQGLVYYTNQKSDAPVFDGGYESGVNLPLSSAGLSPIKSDAKATGWDIPKSTITTTTYDTTYYTSGKSKGKIKNISSSTTTSTDTAYITFKKDSIQIKMGYNLPSTTYLTSTKTTDGVIYVEGMDVRLQGTVKGMYTIASEGNVWLDGDIVYNTDPLKNSNSKDLLGIVAQNDVWITDNKANSKDINIDAAIYTQTGSFGAQNYSARGVDGNINLVGGITQNTRGAVGTFSGSNITSGFSKRYKYDNRLLVSSPPLFPGTGSFEVVSWLEE